MMSLDLNIPSADAPAGKRVRARPASPAAPALTHGVKTPVAKSAGKGGQQHRPLPGGAGNLTEFGRIYQLEPLARIHLIKDGINAGYVSRIARLMDRSKEHLSKTLGLSITTIDRKTKARQNLSSEQSERLIGMARLIGQVQTMVDLSGDSATFDAAQWLAQWLDEPLPALGGARPAQYMDTAEGREFISTLLATAQSGAYV